MVLVLLLLVALSAFFSCAETAFMAINRYRLRHEAHLRKRAALLTLRLLQRPDQLLSLVLVGNTIANVASASVVTCLTISCLGADNVWWTTLILTLIILICAETAPKTLAALYPERLARVVVFPIYILHRCLFPLIALVNKIANLTLWCLGFKLRHTSSEGLSDDELRILLHDSDNNSATHHSMLIGVMDLKTLTVNNIMIDCYAIEGLDISLPWSELVAQLMQMKRDWLPVYCEDINQILGLITSSDLASFVLAHGPLTNLSQLKSLLRAPYFIPDRTTLAVQLHNFKLKREAVAFVVDEYGEVLGMLTMNDILEEIVGEFTSELRDFSRMLQWQDDGSCLVEGIVLVRDFNRFTNWSLPLSGSRTINGLITEHLESFPRADVGLLIAGHPVEIMLAQDNRVKLARIYPALKTHEFRT